MRTLIKDNKGATKGWTINTGYRIMGYNSKGQYVGYYLTNLDQTFNKSGQYIGSGNQLSFLINDLDN